MLKVVQTSVVLACRECFHGHGNWSSHDRVEADCGGHEHGILAARLQSNLQQRWNAPLHFRRAVQGGNDGRLCCWQATRIT